MLGKKLYVGNLYCLVSKEQLRELFSQYGRVLAIEVIEGSGYAYVEMSSPFEAEKAKRALDGAEHLERVLRVKDAYAPVPFTPRELKNLIEE
ncbi:MAG: RNA recognition motif domain-containing protein [Candidatus Aminicenantales bacterium]